MSKKTREEAAVSQLGVVVPDKLLTVETVGSVPPGTTGYIDPYFLGVDADKRAYLYRNAPLSRTPDVSPGRHLLKVMRTHEGWTVYALNFTYHRWCPNAILWPFATEADLIPVMQIL